MSQPTTPPAYPTDELADRVRDFFLTRFQGDIAFEDARWLAGLIAEFIRTENVTVDSNYQQAARRFLQVLSGIDQAMSKAKDPGRRWREVALALGLRSACETGITGSELARKAGVTKMAVSYNVRHICSILGVQPAFQMGGHKPQFRNLT